MAHKLCFSVFDDTVGTKPVHFIDLSEEESQKLSIRMLMGAAATDILREASAVMPLHDIGGVAYSFFFGIPCKSKRSPITMACLTYVIPEELQSQLYTKVPVFNYHSSNIAKQLAGLILYEPGYEMDEGLRHRRGFHAAFFQGGKRSKPGKGRRYHSGECIGGLHEIRKSHFCHV